MFCFSLRKVDGTTEFISAESLAESSFYGAIHVRVVPVDCESFPLVPYSPLSLGHSLVIVGRVGHRICFLYVCLYVSVWLARLGYSLSPPGGNRFGS